MPQLKGAEIGYGQVEFIAELPAEPASSRHEGNVTYSNAGSPGRPAYFSTAFMLTAELEHEGVAFRNIFHWNGVVTDLPKSAPYSEVELQAAQQIAPMLRAFADRIEQLVAEAAS